jgi:hypothetical protein
MLSACFEGEVDEGFLLHVVGFGRAGGWAGCGGALHAEDLAVSGEAAEARHDER